MKQVVLFHVIKPPFWWRMVLSVLILFLVVSATAAAKTTGANIVVVSKFSIISTGAPAVTGIFPDSGPVTGSTSVTITGTGLHGATAVNFGSTPATGFVVVSDLSITATAPANAAAGSVVDITVTTSTGTSAISKADEYTYSVSAPAPAVTGISPARASTVVTTMIPLTTRAPIPAAVSVIASVIAVRAITFTKRK